MSDPLLRESKTVGMTRYRTALMFGGPLDGQYMEVEPHLAEYKVLSRPSFDGPTVEANTETYRRHTFGLRDAGVIILFAHESMDDADISRRILHVLAAALNAYPTDRP